MVLNDAGADTGTGSGCIYQVQILFGVKDANADQLLVMPSCHLNIGEVKSK